MVLKRLLKRAPEPRPARVPDGVRVYAVGDIHGRLDLSAPLLTAWQLARAWPEAKLVVVEDSGHTGSPTMRAAVKDAIALATTWAG